MPRPAVEDVPNDVRFVFVTSEKLPVPVRLLFGLLSLLGCVFAIAAWMFIPTPIGIFLPKYQYSLDDTLISIAGSALALTGYFVWASWISIAVRGRSFFRREWVTQLISLLNHTGWLVLFPFIRREPIWEMFLNSPGLSLWLVSNMMIAVVFLIGSSALEGDS